MAKYERLNQSVKPFASNSTGLERTVFGDTTQSDDINDNVNSDFLRGWGILGLNDVPTKQDFNGMTFTVSSLIAYLYQQGIPEWNTNQEYYVGGFCSIGGVVYVSKSGVSGTPNINNNPETDSINWESLSKDSIDDYLGGLITEVLI